ncbi:MAG TPA: hypothetical protein VH740_15000 [Vicinamibacterales bacterium]|jgi:hypothetical protein
MDASQGALEYRALTLVVLLLSYGAVGARQPAVRMAVPLPVPSEQLADSFEMVSIDRGHFVLNIIRTLFATGVTEGDLKQRAKLRALIDGATGARGEAVPLPLDASIWRETLLQRNVPDDQIMGAILADRRTALLYHGLAGLDDDTLAWLGPERETLQHLLKHAGAFAVFGPSVRVQAGKIRVPGGADAEPLWQEIVGADPARPAAFVRRLFGDEEGQLAWFYDSMAQLDENRLRFALGSRLPANSRADRVRALLDVFENGGSEWRPEVQPFTRRPLDPALTLALLDVNADGTLAGPSPRAFWERVFDDEAKPIAAAPRDLGADATPVDAAWLTARIHRVPLDVGRRRLEVFLFGQRVFRDVQTPDAVTTTALRAHLAFPSLLSTLERAGVRSAQTMVAAATRAESLTQIGDDDRRRVAILEFQAAVGILERMNRAGSLVRAQFEVMIADLSKIEPSGKGYEGKLGAWLKRELERRSRQMVDETADLLEDTLLAAMAGADAHAADSRVIEWEGRSYRVNPARAELLRLRRIRERQGGLSLTAALDGVAAEKQKKQDRTEAALSDTLVSILYAAYLGDPDGPAVASGNIAVKHDLAVSSTLGWRGAWRLPSEGHTGRGWRVSGSLLGLDVALARMALRRLDSNVMPPEPRLVSAERQTAALSVALLNPAALSDAARDEISAALGRGRARLAAVDGDRQAIDAIARDAGLSAWRREALAWTATHDRDNLASQLSLVETMWLGKPKTSEAISLDGWGAAVLPLNGCVCLAMPRAAPWEALIGRPSLGLLATRGADVAILVADTLAALKMPAEIAPGVIAFAMQEVMDQARPSHFDDWSEFTRAARAVPRGMLVDYIAAQAAGGPLLPARSMHDRH